MLMDQGSESLMRCFDHLLRRNFGVLNFGYA